MSHQTLDDLYSQLGQRVAVSTLRCPLEEPLNSFAFVFFALLHSKLSPTFPFVCYSQRLCIHEASRELATREIKARPEDDGEE